MEQIEEKLNVYRDMNTVVIGNFDIRIRRDRGALVRESGVIRKSKDKLKNKERNKLIK